MGLVFTTYCASAGDGCGGVRGGGGGGGGCGGGVAQRDPIPPFSLYLNVHLSPI